MADVSPEFEFEDWVGRARAVDILQVAQNLGVSLKRQGGEWVGPCPACGGTDRFAVHQKRAIFNCSHQGGPGGDVIAMLMHAKGLDFMQAVEELAQEPPPRGQATEQDPELQRERRDERRDRDLARQQEEQARLARKRNDAEELWERRQPLIGSLADAYLRRRRIEVTQAEAAALGFLPAHPYWGYPDGNAQDLVEFGSWPVLMAVVTDVSGRVIAVNRTYLDRDEPIKLVPPGDRKRNKAKKAHGTTLGGATWFGPPCETIAIGEGAETVLSWFRLFRGPEDVTPVSSVSIGNLAGGATGTLPHPKNPRRSIPNGEPDPEKPGIILPPFVKDVILLGDGDSDPAWTRAQLITAGRRFESAGLGVSVDLAGRGKDFNDHLLEEPA